MALFALAAVATPSQLHAQDEADDPFLELGTEEGLGGEDFMKFDRDQIKHQIKTFIPPLLRPAFTQHAFVLPPGLFSVSVTHRFATIEGDDFFMNGQSNTAVFANSEVERQLTDLNILYGFDLNQEYLHGFTARVNIPYRNSQVSGFIHPGGLQSVNAYNTAGTQEIGDIGLFLKKKVLDQGNGPFGLAVVGAVFLPTGANDEKYGDNGTITTQMLPAAPARSVFQRFSDDGRLPTTLQPGTGGLSYLGGVFLTRQFSSQSPLGRSALHLGVTHRFVPEEDGIDAGDMTTMFASLVVPIREDFLAADLTCIAFDHGNDSYAGTFMAPGMGVIDRPSFSGGTTVFVVPSLIFSPDPQVRMTLSAFLRIQEPDLGPAPETVIRFGAEMTF